MPNPNPLFLRWLKSFHAEKDYKIRGGPPRPTGYENAIHTLSYCTTRYEHPLEMKGLYGVGPTCIARLTEKLEEYCNERGIEMPEPPAKKSRAKAKPKAPVAKPQVNDAEEYANSEEEANPVKKPRARAPKRKTTRGRRQLVAVVEEYANSEEEANPVKRPRARVPLRTKAEVTGVKEYQGEVKTAKNRKGKAGSKPAPTSSTVKAGAAPEEIVEPEPQNKGLPSRKTTSSSAKRKRGMEDDEETTNDAVESNPPAKARRASRRTKAPVSYAE